MFDSASDLDATDLAVVAALLAGASVPETGAERVERLEALERLKSAACAAQARIAAELADTGQPMRSVGAQVGLARHESPHRGRRLTGLAVALVNDLPHTLAALERGDINEHRAQLIADGTRDLSPGDRRAVDAALVDRLPTLGDREVTLATAREAMRVDPAGTTQRREAAASRRHVSGRWLGDGTGLISAVVADTSYAAIMTSLRRAAETDRVGGDERSVEQLVADHFVARLTGQVTAQRTPVRIDLVVSAETLLGDDDEPADVAGFGPVPASVARGLVHASPEQATRIRRLFRVDDTDHLVAMESTARNFDGLLREFITLRDQVCRTPWCGGRIRAADHVRRAADGGPTSTYNGQGLCEDCNLTKETLGWRHTVTSGPLAPHEVEITTPTGQVHRSRAPDLPRARADWVEVEPGRWILAA
jgi:hypothetical protein